MKKWYQWFYLSLAFAVGGILNYFGGRQITAAIIQVGLTAALGFVQFFCDKKDEKGRKIFRYICIVMCILLIASLVYMVLSAFG